MIKIALPVWVYWEDVPVLATEVLVSVQLYWMLQILSDHIYLLNKS